MFNSYVSLPEGRCSDIPEPPSGFNPLWVQHPSTAFFQVRRSDADMLIAPTSMMLYTWFIDGESPPKKRP